jgi:hypothetical protein
MKAIRELINYTEIEFKEDTKLYHLGFEAEIELHAIENTFKEIGELQKKLFGKKKFEC